MSLDSLDKVSNAEMQTMIDGLNKDDVDLHKGLKDTYAVLMKDILDKMKYSKGEIEGCKGKMEVIAKILGKINKGTDKSGNVDLSKDPEVLELLAQAKEMGVEFDSTKLAYSTQEAMDLRQSLHMFYDRQKLHVEGHQSEFSILHQKSNQYHLMLNHCHKVIKNAKDKSIQGIRG